MQSLKRKIKKEVHSVVEPSPSFTVGEVSDLGFTASEVIAFLKSQWQRPSCYLNRKFYDWQFVSDPDNPGRDHNIIILDSDKLLKGFIGVTRRNFVLSNQDIPAAYFTSSVMDSAARGVGAMGVSRYIKKYSVSIGASLSEKHEIPSMACSFSYVKYLRYLPRYVRVINPDAVRPYSEIEQLGEIKLRSVNRNALYHGDGRPASDDDWFQAAEQHHAQFNCFARDRNFLQWRYRDHPVFKYELYAVNSGGRMLLVVMRIDVVRGMKIAHIVDFFGEQEILQKGVQFIESLLRDKDVDVADFYCTSSKIGRAFWAQGWISAVDDYYINIPHLFYPIELHHPATSSLGIVSERYLYELVDLERLYITKADCDLDKPTPQYINSKGIKL